VTAAPLTHANSTNPSSEETVTPDLTPNPSGPSLQQTGLTRVTLGAFIALFIGIYAQTFVFMANRWMIDPSATHGWLVIPIAVWAALGKKEKLRGTPLSSNAKGLWVMGFALAMHLIEVFFDINGPSPLSIPIFLAGAVWYFAGSAWLKELAFPIAYLLFMVPIPGALNQMVSQPLRQLAHAGTKRIIEALTSIQIAGAGMNMEFWRPGTDHTNPERDFVSLVIADPCSGLHSLMAIKALHAITAYKSRLTLSWKWALFMLAMPISLAANVCRLVLVILVAAYYSKEFGLKAFHDYSPYILFIFVFMILVSIGRFMEWATEKYPRLSAIIGSVLAVVGVTALCGYIYARFGESIFMNFAGAISIISALVYGVYKGGLLAMRGDRLPPARYIAVLPMLAIALAGTAYFKLRPEPEVRSADVHQVPTVLGEWKMVHEYPENKELTGGLKADSMVMREYANLRTGQIVQLYLVYRKFGRREFNHNPDQCFPSGGYILKNEGTSVMAYGGKNTLAKTMNFDGSKVEGREGKVGAPNTTVSYFFASGSKTECVFLRQQLWMALERIIPNKNGWTLVRLMTNWRSNESDSYSMDALAAQQEFMQVFGPDIQRVITTDTNAAPINPAATTTAPEPFGS
jgi:exosortase